MQSSKPRKAQSRHSGEKYLAFMVGGECYAIPVRRVSEIVGYMDITSVAGAPQHVRGMIQLRERTITVVDLRSRFKLPPTERNHDSCIIVLSIEHAGQRVPAGIVVDQVGQVQVFGEENTLPTNAAGDAEPAFITGISRVGDRTTALIDVDRLLNAADCLTLNQLPRAA